MKTLIPVFIAVAAFSLHSCNNSAKLEEQIVGLEAELEKNMVPQKMEELAGLYIKYVDKNPSDAELSPTYLKKAGNLKYQTGKASEAASHFERAIRDYFDSPETNTNITSLATIYLLNLAAEGDAAELAADFVAVFPDKEIAQERLLLLIEKEKGKIYDEETQQVDRQATLNFVNLSDMYAWAFPGAEDAVDKLFRAAEMARSLKQYQRGLKIYDRIYTQFSGHEKAPQALFLKAFTLDNDIKKTEEARLVYESFLEKYPKNGFADDAQFLLDNLGKSDEEIISSFNK